MMKKDRLLKIAAALAAAVMLLVSAALAEDVSGLTDEELKDLYRRVTEEMKNRGIAYAGDSLDGSLPGTADAEMTGRLYEFFVYWSAGRYDDMLNLCSPIWKEGQEEPRTELFRILANRTPVSLEILAVSGDATYAERTVTATSHIDRNNGTAVEMYLFHVEMWREDGLWYVNPDSLTTCQVFETVEEPTPVPAEEAEVTDDTVLYYNAEGGEYYHADPYCRVVHPNYQPLTGMFTAAQLNDEPYRDLKPCAVCGAPLREE